MSKCIEPWLAPITSQPEGCTAHWSGQRTRISCDEPDVPVLFRRLSGALALTHHSDDLVHICWAQDCLAWLQMAMMQLSKKR